MSSEGPGRKLRFTQEARHFPHDVVDEEVQAPGQVLAAAGLPLLAWGGLPAVPLDVHHQPASRGARPVTSQEKRADGICLEMPPPRHRLQGAGRHNRVDIQIGSNRSGAAHFGLRKSLSFMQKDRQTTGSSARV